MYPECNSRMSVNNNFLHFFFMQNRSTTFLNDVEFFLITNNKKVILYMA